MATHSDPIEGESTVGVGDCRAPEKSDLPGPRWYSAHVSAQDINARAAAIKPSATLAISAKAKALKADGKDVLSFSAGEPDFKPPTHVVETIRAKLAGQPVGYAPVPGLPDLRDAVAEELSAYHEHAFTRNNILVSNGAKHSLANFFLVTLSQGDEVVFPAPFWVSYPEMIGFAGGTSKIVKTTSETGLKLTPELLAPALNNKTRVLLLNNPGNPTGIGYSFDEIRALGECLHQHAPQAYLLVDDIYRKLTYGSFEHSSAFKALKGISERIVIVDGLSKSHAMTGFRIGFLCAPEHIIKATIAVQGQTTSGAGTPSQWGAVAAMDHERCAEDLGKMKEAFTRRRAIMLEGLRSIVDVSLIEPDGAFYCFADFGKYMGRDDLKDDLAFASWLLEEKLVATVPGSAFGAPGYLRLSFATSDENIVKGIERIAAACKSLRP